MPDAADPPIWCLPAALASVALLMLLSGVFLVGDRKAEAFRVRYLRDLAAAAGHDGRGMLLVGDSRLRQAVEIGPSLEDACRIAGIDVPVVVRLIAGNAPPDLTPEVLCAVERMRPGIIVVQAQSLLYRSEQEGWFASLATSLRHRIRSLRSGGVGLTYADAEVADFMLNHDERVTRPRDGRRFWRRRESLRLDAPRRDLISLMRAGRQAGAKIFVVGIPAEPSWDALDRHRQEVDPCIRDLAASGLVEGLRCPLSFPAGDYVDGAHMGPSGRSRFTAWLLAEIASRSRP